MARRVIVVCTALAAVGTMLQPASAFSTRLPGIPSWQGMVKGVRGQGRPRPSPTVARARVCETSMNAETVQAADRPVQENLETNVAAHAKNLQSHGFAVLANPVMDVDLVRRARDSSATRLSSLLEDVKAAGCHPFEQQYRFREIAKRQRHRWDLQLYDPGSGFDDSTWGQLGRAAVAAATPVIREAQGEAYTGVDPVMVGAVISRPGARVQRFHCDAEHEHFLAAKADPSHRLYNVFVPLVDVQENGDGTEFWGAPALEDSTRALSRHFLQNAPLPPVEAGIEAPACAAGGLILYDYRTVHRGLANDAVSGRERAVAYVIIATGGAKEGYNFPRMSVAEPDAETVENFPFFDSLQGRGRGLLEDDLEYASEISGPDRFAIPIEFSFLKWGWGGGAANVFSKLARVLLSLENAVVARNGRLEA